MYHLKKGQKFHHFNYTGYVKLEWRSVCVECHLRENYFFLPHFADIF